LSVIEPVEASTALAADAGRTGYPRQRYAGPLTRLVAARRNKRL